MNGKLRPTARYRDAIAFRSRVFLRGSLMKLTILALCLVSLALGACRREVPDYVPMKLGSNVQPPSSN